MQLPKFSLGMGDRFAHQAKAQLQACIMAAEAGADITPVWNKSNREHLIIGSEPGSVAVCGIRSHNGFTITIPRFKSSVKTATRLGVKADDAFCSDYLWY